ncbi:MAG: hypothetical protein ABSG16_23885 [Candidatus Acidiferrum sp.]
MLLLPQFLAWAYATEGKWKPRALGVWLVSELALLLVAATAQIVGAPISAQHIVLGSLLLTITVFLPARAFRGARISPAAWNRAGLVAAGLYIALAAYAHQVALDRVRSFAKLLSLDVQSLGALPLPPSLWHWDGLVRTPRGVYDWRMDLSEKSPVGGAARTLKPPKASPSVAADEPPLKYSFYPEAFPNAYIERARQLPEVEKVLWFSRFPLTRFHQEGDDAVVEISDKRFPQLRPDRPAPFTYRVRFAANGQVVAEGWER